MKLAMSQNNNGSSLPKGYTASGGGRFGMGETVRMP
jgi:hypothetical protein